MQLMLEHSNLLDVPAYQSAHFSGHARLSADDQNAAQPIFQLFDPLRYRRGSNVESPCRAFETSLPHYGGNSRQGGVIQHD
jgi:hypothetical protein